jgi:hyperosmotically inducible periplasmic protein
MRASNLVFVFLAGAFGAQGMAATPYDAWITMKTKIALATEAQITAANGIRVDTVNGLITLSGKVASEVQKANATAIAGTMKGVKGVRNLLQVVVPATEDTVGEADERIKEKVASLLQSDVSLAASDISVKAVDKGTVVLSGTAKTLSAALRAVESASSVPGVRRVASEIKTPFELTGFEFARAATETKDVAADNWTTTEVKFRLLADENVPALEVNVDTYRGVVSLFGMVPSDVAKAAAIADAQKVVSAANLRDDLQVVPTKGRDVVDAKDDVIKRDIKSVFKDYPEFKNVDVQVRNGRAHLTGTVTSGWDRLHAATAARGTGGVLSVNEDLHLDPSRG